MCFCVEVCLCFQPNFQVRAKSISTKCDYKNYKIFRAERDPRDHRVQPWRQASAYSLFKYLVNKLLPLFANGETEIQEDVVPVVSGRSLLRNLVPSALPFIRGI